VVAKEILKTMESEKRHAGGRPKKVIKRESATGVRFTKAESFVVKQKALKAGMRVTNYIREMALNGSVTARTNEEERHFIRQLIGISNNLNQLTKKAHQEGLLIAVMHFEKYRNIIDELLEKLKR
jgi:selenophosphate synthase